MRNNDLLAVAKWLGRAFLCCMALVLPGCSNPFSIEGRLNDYADRVQRVTGISNSDWDSEGPSLLHYPRRRDRLWSMEASNIGLLDFVALGDCELQQLVGQKNSGLGAVMPVSQRLLYEHRFIASAPRCIEQLEDGSQRSRELAKRLDAIVMAKKNELSKVYWNATFGSPEFERFFSLAADPLPLDGERVRPEAAADALRYLISLDGKLGTPDTEIRSSELELQYKQLQATRYGGRLLRSVHLLSRYLELVAINIQRRLDSGVICPNDNVSDEARAMETIFKEFYVADIQPYISGVYQETRTFLELANTLASSFDGHMPRQYIAYYQRQLDMDRDNGLWKRFERAIKHHSEAWQRLLGECNLHIGVVS